MKFTERISKKIGLPQDEESRQRRHNRVYTPAIVLGTAAGLLMTINHVNATEEPEHPQQIQGREIVTITEENIDGLGALVCNAAAEITNGDETIAESCFEEAHELRHEGPELHPEDTLIIEVTEDGEVLAKPPVS